MVGYKRFDKKQLTAWSLEMIAHGHHSKLFEQSDYHTGQCVNTIDASNDVNHLENSGVCPSNTRKLTRLADAESIFFSYNFSEESRACLEIVYSLPSCSQYVGSRVSESQFHWNLTFDSRARISGERWTSHSPLAFVSGFLKIYFFIYFYSRLDRAH